MRKALIGCLSALLLLSSCGDDKQPAASAGTAKNAGSLTDRFPVLPLPIRITDTLLGQSSPDSLLLDAASYKNTIPDSVFTVFLGKGVKPKLYAIGQAVDKDGLRYLLLKASGNGRRAAYVVCLNDAQKLIGAQLLVNADEDAATIDYGELDNKYTLTAARQRRNADGQIIYKKEYYACSASGIMLVTRETNDVDAVLETLYNPIDTLPAKNKFSGDYVKNKTNIVSIRDGKDAKTFLFFIHFDKKDDDCGGELKGTATWATKDSAIYREDGDPCQLAFLFRGNEVRLREVQGCGNYRGIKCFFEDSYPKKKVAAPAKKK
jgi:hypothetical protein